MTAGQRNCHIALSTLRDQYGEHNIAFALRELLMERITQEQHKRPIAAKRIDILERFAADLDELRVYLATIA